MSVQMSEQPAPELQSHVLYINWDGFAYAWYELVNASYAGTPHLNALLRDGVLFTQARSGIPSITGAIQQCIASGAWPADTGNCYRYYDAGQNRVIQFARQNKLENIAEAAVRHGVSVAAVNAWYFENRGTYEGNEDQPYIKKPVLCNFSIRVDELIQLIAGEPIQSGERSLAFPELPRFLAVYADDIDTVSHNGRVTYPGLEPARTRQAWYDNIAETIMRMDADLGRLVAALQARGLYERTTIVLTTDHGMVPFGAAAKEWTGPTPPEAMSCLPDLVETIARAGIPFLGERFRVEVLCQDGQQAGEETDVVVTVVTLQAQINFRRPDLEERHVLEEIVRRVRQKPYYGTHLQKDELLRRGALPGFADLLISPAPPYHMSWDKPDAPRAVGANHDSLHPNVQHIFTMMSGARILKGITCEEPISIVDMAPTMARLLGFEGPRDAVGNAADSALEPELRGPRLLLLEADTDLRSDVTERAAEPETARLLSGLTEPFAEIRLNRQAFGTADSIGRFRVALPSPPVDGFTRVLIESVSADTGRIRRQLLHRFAPSAEIAPAVERPMQGSRP